MIFGQLTDGKNDRQTNWQTNKLTDGQNDMLTDKLLKGQEGGRKFANAQMASSFARSDYHEIDVTSPWAHCELIILVYVNAIDVCGEEHNWFT